MNFQRLLLLLGAAVCVCDGVHVTVREKQRFAMLFQSVVLPCQFQTGSVQPPVVQWWYKSYCRDRSRESFSLPETLGLKASELGAAAHLECSDSGRTVRIVASAQGASMTLAEHYKGRDIAIVNKADLRIGELQWGDSGVYFCKVVIADDLEGKNEAQLELLVLGRTGEQDDLLPEFDVEIMPEWLFVGCIVLSSLLLLLLLGVCWCQCCPHSCCCYVRCCCCPETCCCPRHLYEAGKTAKSARPAQLPVYPYYIPGVPAVLPVPPSSHLDPKISSMPSLENNLAGAGSFSELSSLHDGGTSDFRHAYQTVQMKALPPIADLRPAAPAHSRRPRPHPGHLSDDELDRRWNCRSEHLQRKTLSRRGRTGSLDELEEFARSYGSRGRRTEPRDRSYERDYSPARRFYGDEEDWAGSPSPPPQKRRDTWDSDRPSGPRSRGYDHAFLSGVLQSKARTRGGAGRPDEDSDTPSKGSSRGKDSCCSRSPSSRPEDDDPLPPYSEREAERHRRNDPTEDRYRRNDPTEDRYRRNDPTEDRYRRNDPTEDRYRRNDPTEDRYRTTDDRYRTTDDRYRTDPPRPAASRPFSYTRNHQGASQTLQGPRQDRNLNLNSALSRDTLIV